MEQIKVELLAPAGDRMKLETALHFGADAVYCAGKSFGLRASSKNFDEIELYDAVKFVQEQGKKIYITTNIYAENKDFDSLGEYLKYLEKIKVDAIIVSDPGVIAFAKEKAPNLPIHLSTQANATNKYAIKFWHDIGVERVVLAREMSLDAIKEVKDFVPTVEIEAFVHGAMCMAYSGRCLLSNYLTSRNGNKGECVQACRWEWEIHEKNHADKKLTLTEDERGTYIMNSKDLNMIEYLGKLMDAGVDSFKIEGRMKTQYYVGCVINAYRQAIDFYKQYGTNKSLDDIIKNELLKIAHRDYTTGFYFGNDKNINIETSQAKGNYDFMAEVKDYDANKKMIVVEQRNRFKVGETLEILSKDREFLNKEIKITKMFDADGVEVDDAKRVQQILYIPCKYQLNSKDMLRKRSDND